MKSQTITILLDQLRFGGAERALVYLARGFVEQGYHVDFLIRNRRFSAYLDDLPPEVNLREIEKCSSIKLRWYLLRYLPEVIKAVPDLLFRYKALPMGMRVLPGLVSYLRSEKPSALLTTMPQNNLLALWAREIAGTPTRVVIREANSFSHAFQVTERRSKAAMMQMAKQWYPRAEGIVSVCEGVGNDLAESLALQRDTIRTIYNPVDLERIKRLSLKAEPHPWFSDKSQPTLVTVGRLNRQKDHKTLLHALKHLNRQRPARLIVIGDGGLKQELQEEAANLGLEDQVHWTGTTDNPYAYMARADAFVLSSAWEGLPNVLLEAFACRTPIISTDAAGGGPAELLQNGRFGRLVPVGEPESLAAAIAATLDAPGDLEDGYRHVQTFTMERSVRNYLSLMLDQPSLAKHEIPERAY